MLSCEDPNLDVEEMLAVAADILGEDRNLQADFEHGQWWVTDVDSGAQWSVNDNALKSFSFERVSQGDEDY